MRGIVTQVVEVVVADNALDGEEGDGGEDENTRESKRGNASPTKNGGRRNGMAGKDAPKHGLPKVETPVYWKQYLKGHHTYTHIITTLSLHYCHRYSI